MNKTDETGAIPLLVLISAVAIIIFLAATTIFSFKNKLFGALFPKSSSLANIESHFSFIDDNGDIISSITDPTVKVRIYSRWPPQPDISPSPSPSEIASPEESPTDLASASASPSPSVEPTYTEGLILSEDSSFTDAATTAFSYKFCTNSGELNCVDPGFGQFLTSYTFTDSSTGPKILCVKFIPTDDQTPNILCDSINLQSQDTEKTETPDATTEATDQPTEQPSTQASVSDLQTPQPTLQNPSLIPRQVLDFLKITPIPKYILPNSAPQANDGSGPAISNQKGGVVQFIRPIQSKITNPTFPFRSSLFTIISGLFEKLLSLINR